PLPRRRASTETRPDYNLEVPRRSCSGSSRYPVSCSALRFGSERRRPMILGMSLATYTFVHVLISLVGIGSGLVVVFGLLTGRRLDGWTALFLASTVATSVTGFGFPFDHLLPSRSPPGLSARARTC